jgi:pimeloyl-ACP methyl ester carboxylesterase
VVVRVTEDFDLAAKWGRVRCRRWGSQSAPLVVCVPGLAGNVENFAFLAERVAGPDLQLVAVDLRGRGHSEGTPPGTYGWERHAQDVFALADSLGFDQFTVVGQSMGGSVAMKAAERDGSRLRAVVLIDVAGRVDPEVGPVIAGALERLGRRYSSAELYLAEVRSNGLIDEWNSYWDRAYRYDLVDVDGGVRTRTRAAAVAEDRAYTASQDPHQRWSHLTMPTLLVRANREIVPGAGHVVPVDERGNFCRAVPHAELVEIDGNHLTVNTHPDLVAAVRPFLLHSIT